jgi:hypothetical protein
MTTQIERTASPRTALVTFRAVTSVMGSELIRPFFSPSQPCAKHQRRDLTAGAHAPAGTRQVSCPRRLQPELYIFMPDMGLWDRGRHGGAAMCRSVGFPDRETDFPTPDRLGRRCEPGGALSRTIVSTTFPRWGSIFFAPAQIRTIHLPARRPAFSPFARSPACRPFSAPLRMKPSVRSTPAWKVLSASLRRNRSRCLAAPADPGGVRRGPGMGWEVFACLWIKLRASTR